MCWFAAILVMIPPALLIVVDLTFLAVASAWLTGKTIAGKIVTASYTYNNNTLWRLKRSSVS